jgi:hypothetical protein
VHVLRLPRRYQHKVQPHAATPAPTCCGLAVPAWTLIRSRRRHVGPVLLGEPTRGVAVRHQIQHVAVGDGALAKLDPHRLWEPCSTPRRPE